MPNCECYFVTEVNGEYKCDCELYGNCPLEPTEDEAYADWCLMNNWRDNERMKIGDYSAGFYVCGEDLFDDDWRKWIEKQLNMQENLGAD